MQARGLLDLDTLTRLINDGEIETVITAVPDLYGRLLGKRIVGRFYLDEIAADGMHMCDYLLACDMINTTNDFNIIRRLKVFDSLKTKRP